MTVAEIKLLIDEYILNDDWYSILLLLTYDNCIQYDVIEGDGQATYPDFFNNNNFGFYMNEYLKLQCEIRRLMVTGSNAVISLFLVKNSMLMYYGIEWEGIANNLAPKIAIKTGLSGQELINETYERMGFFYGVVIPDCITATSGKALGGDAGNKVIGDPNTGKVLTGLSFG